MNFKIGDKVRFMPQYFETGTEHMQENVSHKAYTIESFDYDRDLIYLKNSPSGVGFYTFRFILAEKVRNHPLTNIFK